MQLRRCLRWAEKWVKWIEYSLSYSRMHFHFRIMRFCDVWRRRQWNLLAVCDVFISQILWTKIDHRRLYKFWVLIVSAFPSIRKHGNSITNSCRILNTIWLYIGDVRRRKWLGETKVKIPCRLFLCLGKNVFSQVKFALFSRFLNICNDSQDSRRCLSATSKDSIEAANGSLVERTFPLSSPSSTSRECFYRKFHFYPPRCYFKMRNRSSDAMKVNKMRKNFKGNEMKIFAHILCSQVNSTVYNSKASWALLHWRGRNWSQLESLTVVSRCAKLQFRYWKWTEISTNPNSRY